MRDVDKALADILEIRNRIASHTAFRGYGPFTITLTGVIGLVTASLQTLFPIAGTPSLFITEWLATAAFCAVLIGIEMTGRSRRLHSGLADAMIHQAVEQFLPAAAASFFLPVLLLEFSRENVWMVPGLWQIFVSLGIFASLHNWPRSMMWVGGFYFVTGFATLLFSSQSHALSPMMMGLPFFFGQLLMGAILYLTTGGSDGED
ncbi:hypothetical protein FHS83_002649 [Rhizomicrobium palustre]|uniref:Uncharacterized protein n=1 Tax=Rhizomicrobium palustre TaxID=189966 RepID=A0A846N1Z6_9PROT|nr:hypothetical protein [Rhizomicrobium palustre]NIK89331.1 hypothetical protein [Rhizomicrobium palustre]